MSANGKKTRGSGDDAIWTVHRGSDGPREGVRANAEGDVALSQPLALKRTAHRRGAFSWLGSTASVGGTVKPVLNLNFAESLGI